MVFLDPFQIDQWQNSNQNLNHPFGSWGIIDYIIVALALSYGIIVLIYMFWSSRTKIPPSHDKDDNKWFEM